MKVVIETIEKNLSDKELPHSDYPFDLNLKDQEYKAILRQIGDKDIKRAITFPHLSGYKFEKMLIERFPDIVIHSFEINKNLYHQINESFDVPDNVTFHKMNAVEFIRNNDKKFDIVFFDFCGSPREDINDISSHINPGGLFAITEFYGRKCGEFPFSPFQYFENASFRMRYKHMRFKLYKRNTNPYEGKRVTHINIQKTSQKSEWGSSVPLKKRKTSLKSDYVKSDYVKSDYVPSVPLKARRVLHTEIQITPRKSEWVSSVQPSNRELKREEIQEVSRKLKELSDTITDIDINSLNMHFDNIIVDVFLSIIKTVSFSATTRVMSIKDTKENINVMKIRDYWKTMKDNLIVAVKLGMIYMEKFFIIMDYVDTIIDSKDLRPYLQLQGERSYDVDPAYVQFC